MARQDKDGFFDPALVAAWRRMLWVMRGSADVLEALAPTAAGMTKDEISRLLARAGAPSGKGVEPVEQVLGLLGVVPRTRYDSLLKEHEALLNQYEELASRVEEAERSIDGMRRLLRDQGMADEAEQLLDSWGGLVRRTLRAQAGFVRSIANAGGTVAGPALPTDAISQPQPAEPAEPPPDDGQLDAAPPAAVAGTSPPRPATRRRAARSNGARTSAERNIAPPAGETPEPTLAGQPEPDLASPATTPSGPAAHRRATTTSGTRGGGRRRSASTSTAGGTAQAPKGDQRDPDAASSETAPARRRSSRSGSARSGTRASRTRRPD